MGGSSGLWGWDGDMGGKAAVSTLAVVSHASAGAFLERAGEFAAHSEAEDVLVLGTAGEIEWDARVWPGARFHTVEDANPCL